jgi:hypothetical protein
MMLYVCVLCDPSHDLCRVKLQVSRLGWFVAFVGHGWILLTGVTEKHVDTVLVSAGSAGTEGNERSVVFIILSVAETQYWAGDKIEKNEMGGACSTYGGEERRIQCFVGET